MQKVLSRVSLRGCIGLIGATRSQIEVFHPTLSISFKLSRSGSSRCDLSHSIPYPQNSKLCLEHAISSSGESCPSVHPRQTAGLPLLVSHDKYKYLCFRVISRSFPFASPPALEDFSYFPLMVVYSLCFPVVIHIYISCLRPFFTSSIEAIYRYFMLN